MKRLKAYGIAVMASAAIGAAALSTAGVAAAAPMSPDQNTTTHAGAPSAPYTVPYQPAGLNPDEQAALVLSHHRMHRMRHR